VFQIIQSSRESEFEAETETHTHTERQAWERRTLHLAQIRKTGKTDLGNTETGPKQVRDIQFPFRQFGHQKRCVQKCWYNAFNWLLKDA
jgi:hypothetical protein